MRKPHAKRTNKIKGKGRGKGGGKGRRILLEVYPEIRERIVAMVSEGAPLSLAVVNGKIAYQTLFNYINAGEEVSKRVQAALEEGRAAPTLTPAETLLMEFFDGIREAQARRTRIDVGRLTVFARTSFEALRFRLGSVHRAEFGQQSGASVKVTNPSDGPQTIEFFWQDGSRDEDSSAEDEP